MLRILLATTALAAFSTTTAVAQQSDTSQLQPSVQQPMGVGSAGTGQQVTVNNGDTIVIQPDQSGTFTLHIQLDAGTDRATAATTGANQRLQEGDLGQLTTDNLIGSEVYGANDEEIGNVGDVILTPEGEVDAMIVDVGGFLGIGARQVAIGADNLRFMVDDGGGWHVFTPFTQEQLEAHPEYNQQSYNEQRQQQRLTAQP